LCTSGTFPSLAGYRRELASASGFAFGFFQAFTRPFQLVFCDAHPLLGDVGLQSDPLERLSGGTLCAACLLHAAPVKRKMRSLTQACACFQPPQLSTEIVHNHVDSGAAPSQSMMCPKGLRYGECLFASDVAKCAGVARAVNRCRR
jgi:hypothetical protein